MGQGLWRRISRRMVISGGAVSAGGALLLTAISAGRQATAQGTHAGHGPGGLAVTPRRHDAHGSMLAVGEVDSTRNGFDPTAMLADWETGALDLPFPNEWFDRATLLHVGMNIADKERLCREVYRVLKPGGVFALYDVMRTGDEEIDFPVPWAATPSPVCDLG